MNKYAKGSTWNKEAYTALQCNRNASEVLLGIVMVLDLGEAYLSKLFSKRASPISSIEYHLHFFIIISHQIGKGISDSHQIAITAPLFHAPSSRSLMSQQMASYGLVTLPLFCRWRRLPKPCGTKVELVLN